MSTSTHPPSTSPIVGAPTAHHANPMTHLVTGIAIVLVVLAATIGLIIGQALGARGAEAPVDVELNRPQSEMYAALAEVAVVKQFVDALAAEEAAKQSASTRSVRPAVYVDPTDPTIWDELAHCETRGNWATDSVPGFSGGLGFAHGTWTAHGGGEFAEIAADATREQQIVIAQRVLESSGWGAWPGCSDLMGLR